MFRTNRIKLVFLFLLILISSQLFAASAEDAIQLDRFLEADMNEDLTILNDISDYIEEQRNQSYIPLKERRLKRAPYARPKKFRAHLKKGSIVVDLKTKKVFKTQKGINAWAIPEKKRSTSSYLLNKESRRAYITYTKNLSGLEKEFELHPTIDPNKTYSPVSKKSFDNDTFNFSHNMTFSWNSSTLADISQVIGSEDDKSNGNSFKISSYYNTYLRVNLGLQLFYENGSLNDLEDEQSAKWRTFSIGPNIKYHQPISQNFSLNFILGATRSLLYSLTAGESRFALSQTRANFNIEAQRKLTYGDLIIGIEMTKGYLSWKSAEDENPDNISFPSTKTSTSSTSLYIGYQFGTSL